MDSYGQNQILSIPLSSIHFLYLSIIVVTEMQAYRGAWRSSRECALCHLIMCFMSEKHISTSAIAHNLMCFCSSIKTQYLCAFINVFKPIFSIHWIGSDCSNPSVTAKMLRRS